MDGSSQKDYSGELIGQAMPRLNRKEDGKSLRREKEMYVRLRKEWHWYWKDSILELSDDEARDLIRRRIAIPANKNDCMREIGRAPSDKSLWGPTKDKMVQQSKNKKRNHRSEAPTGAHGKRGDDLNASY